MIDKISKLLVLCLSTILFLDANLLAQASIQYDIVLTGGRVIDPETKLDAIRNIGIINNRIAQISMEPLKGKQEMNVSGLVVAPGFIDLHIHGRTNKEQEYQLHDGLTTALELEYGIENLKEWYATRQSKALINYGASVCWPYERFKAIDKYKDGVNKLYQTTIKGESSIEGLTNMLLPAAAELLTEQEMNQTLSNIKSSLAEGGIGIGVPIGYLPKTDPKEMYQVFQLAGELNALVFCHVRDPNIISIQEVITDAILTNAPLHIVHINSMSLGNIQLSLDMLNAVKNKGFDITTELYPYTIAKRYVFRRLARQARH
jgi:dihydroorotase-like cyclic amidohydrolase